jgi:glutaminyl-tRNA synthetase
VIKDAAGEVVELRCTYDPATRGGDAPDGRKVRGTLHWVAAATAVPAEIRLYNNLFTRPDPGAAGDVLSDLNPHSLETLKDCWLEPALATAAPGEPVQFERQGYYSCDAAGPGNGLTFIRTVGLRDTWAKVQAGRTGA